MAAGEWGRTSSSRIAGCPATATAEGLGSGLIVAQSLKGHLETLKKWRLQISGNLSKLIVQLFVHRKSAPCRAIVNRS
jgi:hypothetical protein